MKKILILAMLTLTVLACNKEKRYSKRLIKGENWNLEAVMVNGVNLGLSGTWKVIGDDIYESVPRIEWTSGSSDPTIIEWQFHDKGETYQFNYVQLCEECDGTVMEETDFRAYDLTGKYQVKRHKRKEMIFSSEETIGYKGQKVEIKISRD